MLQSIAVGTMVAAGTQFVSANPVLMEEMSRGYDIHTSYSVEFALLNKVINDSKLSTEPNLWFQTKKADISPSARLIGKLTSYLELDDGWDGYSGERPSEVAVTDAIQFIQKLRTGLKSAIPMVSSDGEVGLFWKDQENYIDIGFYGDGLYSLYAKLSNGDELLLDDVDINEEINDQLSDALRALG